MTARSANGDLGEHDVPEVLGREYCTVQVPVQPVTSTVTVVVRVEGTSCEGSFEDGAATWLGPVRQEDEVLVLCDSEGDFVVSDGA